MTIGSGPLFASERRSRRLRTWLPLEAEQGRQQGQRGEHRDQDRQRRGDGDAVQERELQDEHAEQRDAHGRAGEEHGATGGVDRRDDGVFRTQAAFQSLSTSRHDEERVVDAHAQSDERTQNGRKGGDGEPVTEQRRRPRWRCRRRRGATPSGSSIAKNDPKASTRTMAVRMSPKIRSGLPFCEASCSKALPANWTLSEDERAVMPAFSTGWICAALQFVALLGEVDDGVGDLAVRD